MRIRRYGLLANCHRERKLARYRELLGVTELIPSLPVDLDDILARHKDQAESPTEPTPSACPVCGEPMHVIEIIAPQRRDTS